MTESGGERVGGDKITTGSVEGVGIAIGLGASVRIYGGVHYYPIQLHAPLREVFDPLIEDRVLLFGGRDTELAQIAKFIQDPAGGYLMITAPAGFGKTALIATLVTQTPAAFAYHFFNPLYGESILSETFFLQNIVEQMAQWHGHKEQLPYRLNDLRALYQKFLDQPLELTQVLVLDGLDEITQWRLSPYLSRRLPGNLHIILTVRDTGQDWISQYHLPVDQTTSLTMGGLQREEIVQVLRTAGGGATVFAEDVHLLDEIVRISAYPADAGLGADPFYVRLLAEDAKEGRLSVTSVTTQPQGLDNYLDNWWQQIKEVAGDEPVNDLFGTLTAALGPIHQKELEAVNSSLVHEWRVDLFDDLLKRVRRFVWGDEKQGYALAHPRLHQYMRSRIKTHRYEAGLLNYCGHILEKLISKELLPKDASCYAVRYYGEHLEQGDAPDKQVYALLCEEWLRAWEWLEGTEAGFLIDVGRVWSRAERAGAAGLGWQVRAALCVASAASAIGNVPSELLVDCVRFGVIGAAQALALARHKPNPEGLVRAMCFLRPHLPEKERERALSEALAATHRIADESYRARVLSFLAPHLPKGMLDEALIAARQIRNDYWRADTLRTLALQLPKETQEHVLREALSTVCTVANEPNRGKALSILVPFLSKEMLGEALVAAHMIQDESIRDQVISDVMTYVSEKELETLLGQALIPGPGAGLESILTDKLLGDFVALPVPPHLPEQEYERALKDKLLAARRIGDTHYRVEAFLALVPHLPMNEREVVLSEALAAVRGIGDEPDRARILVTLAQQMVEEESEGFTGKMLDAACEFKDEHLRAQIWTTMAPYLPKEMLDKVLSDVDQIENDSDRVCVLSALAPYLPEEMLGQLLGTVHTIRDESTRADLLSTLASHLPETLLTQALAAACEIRDEHERVQSLSVLAPYIPKHMVSKTLAASLGIGSETDRARLLVALVPYLTQQMRSEVLLAAFEIGNVRQRTKVLCGLAPYLSQDRLRVVLASTYEIANEYERAYALSALAPYLSRKMRQEAVAAAHAIKDDAARLDALSTLAPCPSNEEQTRVIDGTLAAVHKSKPELDQAVSLSSSALNLPAKDQQSLLGEKLVTARVIGDESSRAEILFVLAPRLPNQERELALDEALAVTRGIEPKHVRAAALRDLALRLPEGERSRVLEEALITTLGIENEYHRTRVLSALAVYLPQDMTGKALAAVLEIEDEPARVQVLSHLASHLPEEMLSDALNAARGIGDESRRAKILSALVLSSPKERLGELLTAALEIGNEPARAEPLSALVPHLPEEMMSEALAATLGIGPESDLACGLSALAYQVSKNGKTQALNDALIAAASEIRSEFRCARFLSSLAPHLPKEMLGETFKIVCDLSGIGHSIDALAHMASRWQEMCTACGLSEVSEISAALYAFAPAGRKQLLGAIGALAPVLDHLGGTSAILETARAIHDTTQWWP